jgi:LmbE family N-acetylglucosaminyl deacetylase
MGVITCATLVPASQPDDKTLEAGGSIAKLRSQGVPVTVSQLRAVRTLTPTYRNLGKVREGNCSAVSLRNVL